MTGDAFGRRFKRWLSSPPRTHGEVVTDRTVSFLELVYAIVIAQAAGHLAENVSMSEVE